MLLKSTYAAQGNSINTCTNKRPLKKFSEHTGNNMFVSARLKIERAKSHITELDREIANFLSRDPYRLVLDSYDQRGWCCWRIHVIEDAPLTLSAMIGDAIHNLRTSLDHLAHNLVLLNQGNTHNVYFPFCNTETELDKVIKDRHLDQAGPGVVNIIKMIKPYRGGNDLLRLLHDLDIIDKHQLLLTTLSFIGLPNMSGIAEGSYTDFGKTATNGGFESIRCYTPPIPNVCINQEFVASVELSICGTESYNINPVVPLLHMLTQCVEEIVNTFEEYFNKSSKH
jgi:hypothetical protein